VNKRMRREGLAIRDGMQERLVGVRTVDGTSTCYYCIVIMNAIVRGWHKNIVILAQNCAG